MGPTDIVLIQKDNNKSLFNSACSIMSTSLDSSEVTLASSQTQSSNNINSSLVSSIDQQQQQQQQHNNNSISNSLSSSLESLYSPEILSRLSLSATVSPSFSPSSFSSLNFNTLTEFNVYYPPPLNIAGDDDFYSSNSSNGNSMNSSSFLPNKRKSPYLYKSEKNPSRCLSCNRVILKYIVGVNNSGGNNNSSNGGSSKKCIGKVYPKSTGYKCSQCNTAICEKCVFENTNNPQPSSITSSSSSNTFSFVSTCNNCMKKENKKTTSIIVKY